VTKHGVRALVVAGAPVLTAVLLWLPALWWPVSTLDEAILLVYPQRMASGDLPYQDFFAAYGPAYWWGLHAWYELTGLTITSMRALGLVLHIALVLGILRLARPLGRASATTCGLLGCLLLFRLGAAPYAWLVTTVLCIWQVQLVVTRPLLAGVLCGLAISVRPDVALLALVPSLILLTQRRARWFVGVMSGLLPIWVSVILTPGGLIEDVLLGRAGKGASQSRLPIPPPAAADRRLLAVLLATVVLMLMLAGLARNRRTTALAAMSLLALPQAFQRADYTHFVYAGLFCLPLLPLAVTRLLERLPNPPPRPRVLGALLGVMVFLVAVPEIPRNITDMLANGNMRARVVHHAGRWLPEAPARADLLGVLLPAVDAMTRPGDTLFVFDANLVRPAVDDVSLYYYLPQLRQVAFHMEITPGITSERGSGLVHDITSADLVILERTPEAERRMLFPYARGGSDDAQRALTKTFCLRRVIERYELWARCR
jgi:hypothetical protein